MVLGRLKVSLKLLFVINNLHTGGVQKSLINLLGNIDNDYSVTLFVFNYAGNNTVNIPKGTKVIRAKFPLNTLGMSVSEAKDSGILTYFAKILFSIISRIFGNASAINLAIFFGNKFNNYDCAISYMHIGPRHLFFGGTNEFVLKNVHSSKKLAFVHCDYRNCGSNIEYATKLYMKFDRVAFCSKGCMKVFNELAPKLKRKSAVIHNTHNIPKIILDASKEQIEYKKDVFNIVIVSRLTVDKGIDIAINAVNDCIQRFHHDINLHIVGDGRDKNSFISLTNKLKIEDKVHFCGNQDNPYRYMKNADLLLMTSHHEAAPMIFDEANILNIPILTTHTTSTQEMITERNAGWVCKNNQDVISEYINSIINGDRFLELDNSVELDNIGILEFNKTVSNLCNYDN